MTDSSLRRLPEPAPATAAPPHARDRRVRARRRADHHAHEELAFLSRCLNVLAGSGSAEERLASLLDLLAETTGARRAAVLADTGERRVAVVLHQNEDPTAAEDLAAWLDARAPRTRAERAAAGPALVSLAVAAPAPPPRLVGSGGEPRDASADAEVGVTVLEAPVAGVAHYACLSVPSSWPVVLGFEFGDADAAESCARRLPPAFIRHAGAALAMIAESLATERELELLRAQDAERTRFVSTVAHELRTPLTGLGGYLELILTGAVEDPAIEREFLERSRDIVGTIDELVGDLLELSRLESGSLRLEIDQFSVAEVCERVVEHVAPISLARTIHLESNLPPRLRAASGDRRRVEQILKNLVGNALKFTPSGGRVELAAWFDGPAAVLAVRDNGAGISSEDRERIWERFYRMASHERINGTGLGLPIARDLARAMGGDLGVASVPRTGSSFVLVLPGPSGVPADTIEAILERALGEEEVRLDDEAMRRRLAAFDRGSHAFSRPTAAGLDPQERTTVRLRSLQGGMSPVPVRPA